MVINCFWNKRKFRMDTRTAIRNIREGIMRKNMVTVFGECEVNYDGRATSVLPRGKRFVMIKGDRSISIHQNCLVRPTNYMINTSIAIEEQNNTVLLTAKKTSPKETLGIRFFEIQKVECYEMELENDLRLSGSEKHLNEMLSEDLSMIEEGLKPINQQAHFRKGIADIIAQDSQGRLVIIELKRRQADFDSVMQLKRYMQEVEKLKNITTRGILLAPSIRKNAKELLERNGMEYAKIDFELLPSSKEKAKIKGLQKKQQTLNEFTT
jgi:endonuclease